MNFHEIFNEISARVLPVFKHYREDIKSLDVQIKPDNSLLTQADVEIQDIVVETIRKYDPNAGLIAEEKSLRRGSTHGRYTWVIDPIDGTRPFTSPASHEFCCAVGVLEKGFPVASMVLMPEMGINKTPLLAVALVAANEIFINGEPYRAVSESNHTPMASVTRAGDAPPSAIEERLAASGVSVKTGTTSLIMDLLRTAIDISPYSDMGAGPFRVFHRGRLRLWDIVPGLCFNIIAGKAIVGLDGEAILPYPDSVVDSDDPVSPAVVIAEAGDIRWLL